MKKKNIFTLLLLLFLSISKILLADVQIIVKIDDEIITNLDLVKEKNYLEILNQNLVKLESKQKNNLAKNSLINQIIKQKEAKKININQENELVNIYLQNLYSNLDFGGEEEFKILLDQKDNYTLTEIKEKIKIELMWNKLIYQKFYSQVKINEKNLINKIKKEKDKVNQEYFLSEIVFKKSANKNIKELHEEIKKSINEIGFNNTANIYSESDSSKFGGKIGWFSTLRLSEIIKEKLSSIEKDNFTDLINLGNNYLILKIEDVRIKKIEIDEKKELKKLITIEEDRQLNKLSKIYFDKIKLNYLINEI
jgi:peptidyl-prolyl cis-trans isomerase SurA